MSKIRSVFLGIMMVSFGIAGMSWSHVAKAEKVSCVKVQDCSGGSCANYLYCDDGTIWKQVYPGL